MSVDFTQGPGASEHSLRDSLRRSRGTGALLVMVISVAVFWRTAYPTITWWDSGHYSLAAGTLGVTAPPGSLLLTLLGWPLARFPFGSSPAHVMNLFAGVLAGLTAGLVYGVALRLQSVGRSDGGADLSGATAAGAALGALTFAFSNTLWEHAVKFTPYVLSAVFTALILWTMLRWWEDAERPDGWRRLALLGLLFGLDFSVHRTNALSLPGALVWILLRDPRALRRARTWLGGAGGLVAGLAVQLLIIPIAVFTRSPLNFSEPSNWPRFWDYVSLQQLGGGFLLQLFPRKADFWSVQVADFLHVLGANFFHWTSAVGGLAVLPALAVLFGLTMLWRRNWRLGLAFTLVLCLQAAMTVLYFNIPAQYFRPFDRHYLPVCVTIAVLIAYGLATAMRVVANRAMTKMRVVAAFGAVFVVLVPAAQLVGNWNARDASRRYFTRDYAANALGALPPNAIYVTIGDNDTFPVMYLQAVEGVRPDVTIINLSLANAFGFAEQQQRRDPSFPMAMTREERGALSTRTWSDTTVVIDTVTLRVKGTAGTRMLSGDITLLDIIRTNRWRRPLAFAITVGRPGMSWLGPYGRLDGLFWRIVPFAEPPADVEILRANLMEYYEYRGYADPSIHIDDVTRGMGFQYYIAFTALLEAEQTRRATDRCRAAANRLFAALPPERLLLPAGYREKVESGCGPVR